MQTVTLSISSMKTIKSCQQKYWHKKVNQTPVDSDHEDSDALGFGKAFHKVLEDTFHESYTDKLIIAAMKDNNVDETDRALLTYMLDNYTKLHRASGLKIVKCEFRLEIPGLYLGFIDFIAQEERGWWIGDNKTAARHDPTLTNRLHNDPQVSIYSRFAPEIARALGLKGEFLGFRYRQSIKSKAKTVKGLQDGTPTYDFIIEAGVIESDKAWSNFLDAHEVANKLHNGEAPHKNFGACYEYFRPCEYFSQCHGCLSSEGNPKITIHTLDSLLAADLL